MADVVTTAIYKLQQVVEGTADIKAADAASSALIGTQDKLTASTAKLVAANDEASASITKLTVKQEKDTTAKVTSTQQLNKFIASMDQATRAQLQYQRGLDMVNRFEADGAGTASDRARALQLVEERFKASTKAVNDNAEAHKGLSGQAQSAMHSIRSMGESLALGTPITQVLTQQMGHLSFAASGSGGLKGAFTEAAGAFRGMISPMALAVTGLVAVGAAIGFLVANAASQMAQVKEFDIILKGLGDTTLATGKQMETAAKSLRDSGSTMAEAVADLEAVMRSGLNPAMAKSVVELGRDLSTVLGGNQLNALTTALKGGAKTASDYALSIHAITAAEAEHFESMGRQGEGLKAVDQIYQKVTKTVGGSYVAAQKDATTASKALGTAFHQMVDALSDTAFIQTFTKGLTELAKILTDLFKGNLHVDFTISIPGLPDLHVGGASGGAAGTTGGGATAGATGSGEAGRVSMGSNAVSASGVEQLKQILGAASVILPAGQSFEIFSGYAAGGGNRSTGASSLHASGDAVDFRVIDTATGQPVKTGVVGLPSMGGEGLPTPEMERAVLRAAMAQNTPVSIGSLFGTPDPGHVGIGQHAEVASNQAKQAAFLAAGGGDSASATSVTDAAKAAEDAKKKTDDLIRSEQERLAVEQKVGASADVLAAKQRADNDALANNLDTASKQRLEQAYVAAALGKTTAELDKQKSVVDETIISNNRLTDAYGESGLAVEKATAENQAHAEALQAFGKDVDTTAAEITRYNTLINEKASAERLTNAQDTRQQKDTQAALELEISLQGQSSDVITEQLTLLRAKQDIDEKFPLLSEKEKQARLDNVKATADLNVQLQEAQRAQQRLNDILVNVGQTIDTAITQNISNALSGQKITSWHEIFKNALVQLESQLISMSVIKPAIGSLLSMFGFGQAAQSFGTLTGAGGILGGGGGLLGNVLGGGSQAPVQITDPKTGEVTGTLSAVGNVGSGLGGIGNLFGGGSGGLFGSGGISGFVNNTIGTSLGFAPSQLPALTGPADFAGGGDFGSLFGGTTLGGFLGGVGAGATVGSLANMFLGPMIGGGKSTGGMIGSTGGALAGAIIGSIVPGIGTLLGGIIGGAGGGLLGGFFGPKPANNAGSGSLNLATGQLGAFTSGGVAANDQQAQSILQPISTALSNITGILGQSVLPQATLIAQAGSRDGIKVNIASGQGVQSFTGKDAGTVVQQVAQFLFEHRDLSKLSPTLQTAVGSLDINQIQDPTQLQTAVQFSKIYDSIKTQADAAFQSVESGAQQAGPFEQAMTQIGDTFAQLTDQAKQYGLSIDPINAALAEATKRLNVDFAKAVDAAFNTSSGNDFLNGVQGLVDNYQSMAREASAIGASGSVFDKLGQTFDNTLKTFFSSLTSAQLDQVISQFGTLSNDLPALATAARDAAAATEALTVLTAQQAATYQIQQDSYNAANQGFLAQLRDLDKARITAQTQAKALNLGDDQSAIIQETEHRAALNVMQGLTNDQLEQARAVLADLNPAFAGWVDEVKAATAATKQAADAQAASNAILQAGLQIRQYLNAQEASATEYTSPESRLTAARGQFQTQLGLAQGGDVTALQGITGIADELKAALQGWFASSAPGAAEWEQAKAALAALPGVPNAQQTSTNAIVTAIQDTGTATVTGISDATNASAQTITATTIATNQAIVDNARTTSQDIISATGDSSTRIVDTAIDTSNSIVANGAAASAAIVGATTSGLDLATGATLTSAAQVVAATNNTATAVSFSTDATKSGTLALLDSNQQNAATLIAGSKEDTSNLLAQQEANATSLLNANAAQSAVLVDQNGRNAAAVVDTTNATASSIIAQNDAASKQIIATANATGTAAVATANANTTDMIWTANATTAEVAARNEASVHALDVSTQAGTTTLLAQNQQAAASADALAQSTTDQQIAQAATSSASIVATANAGTASLLASGNQLTSDTINAANDNAAALALKSDAAVAANVAVQQAATASVVATAQSGTTASVNAAYDTSNALGTRTEIASANVAATTKAGSDALIARGDAQIAALQSIAGVTVGDIQVGTAIYNTGNAIIQNTANWASAIYGQIAAYANWAVQSGESWANAIVQNIAYWGNANIDANHGFFYWLIGDNQNNAGNILATTANWSSTIVQNIAGWSNNIIGNAANWGNAIVGQIANYGQALINTVAAWGDAINQTSWGTGDTVARTVASWSQLIASTTWAGLDQGWRTTEAWGNAIVGTIAQWGDATCANIAAWGNAEVANANGNAGSIINMLAGVSNSITNSIFASGDTQIAAIYGSSSNEMGAAFSNGNSIIGAIGSMSVSNIAAIYTSANTIVASTGSISAYIDQARNDNNNSLSAINGTIVWSINNVNDRSHEVVDKLQEILNNMVSWNRNLWDQLHFIAEYMQLLTEVTINFDEFMAGSQGANTDIMNQIQDTLRRQAFG